MSYSASSWSLSEAALQALESRYVLKRSELEPQTYWRLTDNWLEITLRFIVADSGIREVKSKMSREILEQLDRAGIGIASGPYEIVGFPPVKVQMVPASGSGGDGSSGDGAKASRESMA